VEGRERREVNVLWVRIFLPLVAVGLWFALATYQDAAPSPTEIFPPFDPQSVKDWLWFGEPFTRADRVGQVNFVAGATYALAGVSLIGRVRLRTIAVMFAIAASLAVAGAASLLYLAIVDSASFPLASSGMGLIFLFHALGLGGLAAAWWQLRRAAL
jgi:hypothetical protein